MSTSQPTLNTMPPEVLRHILAPLLRLTGPINPYPPSHDVPPTIFPPGPRPTLSLLHVNKRISDLSHRILYRENTFQLNTECGWAVVPPPNNNNNNTNDNSANHAAFAARRERRFQPLWFHKRDLIRDIVIRFDYRDWYTVDYAANTRQNWIVQGVKPWKRAWHEHQVGTAALLENWLTGLLVLRALRPKRIVMDFREVGCVQGCCRGESLGGLVKGMVRLFGEREWEVHREGMGGRKICDEVVVWGVGLREEDGEAELLRGVLGGKIIRVGGDEGTDRVFAKVRFGESHRKFLESGEVMGRWFPAPLRKVACQCVECGPEPEGLQTLPSFSR